MTVTTAPLSVLQILEKGLFSTGSVVQMFQLAEGLARRGHKVAIVSRPREDLPVRAHAASLDFEPLPLAHEFDLVSAWRLARIYEARAVDIVHVHKGIAHSVALFASYMSARRPAVVVNRGVSFPLDRFSRIKYRRRVDAVVAVSQDIRRVVVSSAGIAADKVHVIYAGVDSARFDPSRADRMRIRREWGIADNEILVVQIGAREWKGWRDLLAGVALIATEFPTLKAAVVACQDAKHQALVAGIAREHGISDRVLPIGFRDDMPDVLMAADIVADMSYEGTGVTGTLREAMALGRPVVGTACGGNPELVVDRESGLIVPIHQPAALAGALRSLLSDRTLADRLGHAGRARVVAGFSSEARLDRIEALYHALASARRA